MVGRAAVSSSLSVLKGLAGRDCAVPKRNAGSTSSITMNARERDVFIMVGANKVCVCVCVYSCKVDLVELVCNALLRGENGDVGDGMPMFLCVCVGVFSVCLTRRKKQILEQAAQKPPKNRFGPAVGWTEQNENT